MLDQINILFVLSLRSISCTMFYGPVVMRLYFPVVFVKVH